MKMKSMPLDLFVEVLNYLAEYERLEGLTHILEGQYNLADVRAALRECAAHFRKIAEGQKEIIGLLDLKKDEQLSAKVKQLLSILSPGDEKKLLDRFGLLEG